MSASPTAEPERYDVVVVGGGPTGLTLATLLGRRGVRVAVVERHDDVYPLPRAVHLDDEVYRILLDVGIGAQFAAVSRPTGGLRLVDSRHRVLATFPRTAGAVLPQANMFDQPDLERLLRANLERYAGVERLVRHTVVSLDPGDDAREATVVVRDASHAQRTLRAAYVVGCDGANSFVREALGIGHRTLGFAQRWLIVDARIDGELDAWDGVHQVCDPRRAATYMRVGTDRYRWEFRLLEGETAAGFGDRATLRRLVSPWAAGVPEDRFHLLRCAEYTFRARVARRWRAGRVFLAGDAAHLTPPFIGQGLCAGQRDAANLAWKLAAAVAGQGDDKLLDSYEAERRPHAVNLIRRAVLLGRVMTGGGRAAVLARRRLVPALARVGFVQRTVLDSRTPALGHGPLVDRRLPRRVRGALLPLVPVPGPAGTDVPVDQVLGDRAAVVALAGADPAPMPAVDGVRLTVDPHGAAGSRALARWLTDAGLDWVRVDPDRVVRAGGRAARRPRPRGDRR